MRYLEVGPDRVSVIGLGTWQFGSAAWGYGREYSSTTAAALVRRALDLGVTLIDSAEVYGRGRAERIVGEAVRGRREQVFLATKLYPALPVPGVADWRAALSARRLGVDTLDLYLLHAPNPLVPMRVSMHAMARVQRSGRARHLGVSNVSAQQWRDAEAAVGGPVRFHQTRYSLAVRDAERELLPWAQAHDRVLIAYSPLAQGLLGGRYGPDRIPEGARAGGALFAPEALAAAGPLLEVLREVAAGHGVGPATVALAWLVSRPGVVAIPGARTLGQLEANVAAADLVLRPDEDAALAQASDRASLAVPRRGLVRRVLRRGPASSRYETSEPL